MNRSITPRHRRPVRFNRTRANPIQRLPFYRQSHAKVGDYWRMPEVESYLMGREIGRVCAIAFVQALEDAGNRPWAEESFQLAKTVASAIEIHGGMMTKSQRGIVDGFFGCGSKIMDVMRTGIKASSGMPRFEMEQIEDALSELASMTPEEYAMRRVGPITGAIPDSKRHPQFHLE